MRSPNIQNFNNNIIPNPNQFAYVAPGISNPHRHSNIISTTQFFPLDNQEIHKQKLKTESYNIPTEENVENLNYNLPIDENHTVNHVRKS